MPSRQDRRSTKKTSSLWKWLASLLGLVLIVLAVFVFTEQKRTSSQGDKETKVAQSAKESANKGQSASSSADSNSTTKKSGQSSGQVISSDLVGTWQDQTLVNNYAVTMTFQENGQIDVTID